VVIVVRSIAAAVGEAAAAEDGGGAAGAGGEHEAPSRLSAAPSFNFPTIFRFVATVGLAARNTGGGGSDVLGGL